ncbi:MAG TPA: hypothetical protein VG501_06775 [Rhizomicrobium sp.]|nr:hypothetical protein [Rhizomicrobium sp.]
MSNGQGQSNISQTGISQVRANLISANEAGSRRTPPARRPPRPTTARQSPAGLLISFFFHAGLLTATFLTWNRMVDLSPETHAIPVDLVIERQTNVRAEAPPPEPDKPIRDVLPEPSLPPIVPPEVGPVPPIPQVRIIQPKQADQTPTDQPKSRRQMVKEADSVLDKILAQAKTPKNAKTSDRIIEGAGNQALASADLVDALRSQIDRCWTPPTGAPNANDLVVDFDLRLNADGTVMGRPQLSGNSASAMGNPYTRAAAEAASRAIYACEPYKLPTKRYAEWQEISPLRFDPRQMMGQ